MRKIISIVMALAMIVALFTACSKGGSDKTGGDTTKAPVSIASKDTGEKKSIKIAGLQGPTGMGMAYLFSDAKAQKTINDYEYEVCASPDEVTGRIVSGDLDIAALPTNAAATLYNKSEGKITLLALNTKCVLYLLEKGNTIDDIEDLKGKTVYVSGQGSTPEYILEYLLEANGLKVGTDVKLDFTYATHNDLVGFAATGKADVVLLPEPAVTGLLSKNSGMRVALDIDDVWEDTVEGTEYEASSIAMGCVAVNTKFLKENPKMVSDFMREYEASVEKVEQDENIKQTGEVIKSAGILPSAEVAMKALPRCNITFETGAEMQEELEGFLKVLYDANPSSVGGKIPDGEFYYMGK